MSQSNKEAILEGKEAIHKGPANHVKGIESVGGKMYLTKDELIFISHGLNVQVHELIIDIQKIKEYKCPFFPPTKLKIICEDGSAESYIVYGRKKWINKIEEAKNS